MIKGIIKDSDVIINNFKTGTMERLRLDYDILSVTNTRLIYCSITGFVESGPQKSESDYDFIIQALSRFMSITGTKKSSPQKSGVAITYILTGLYTTIGIQTALLESHTSEKVKKLILLYLI